MVTVIATGFNRSAMQPAKAPVKTVRGLIDHIPTGPTELGKFNPPAFERRRSFVPEPASAEEVKVRQGSFDRTDTDRPAFLRKIMD